MSSHSTMAPPSSRSTTPFMDVDTAVGEDFEWIKVHKPKSERDAEFRRNDAVRPAISSSHSVNGRIQALRIALDLTIHPQSLTSSGSSWSDGYAQTLRTNTPANCGLRTRPPSPLRGSSWAQYNDGVQSDSENHPGTGSESKAQICFESTPGRAAIANSVEFESAIISEDAVTKIKFTDPETGEERVIPVCTASIMSQLGQPIMKIKRVGDSAAHAERICLDAESRAPTLEVQSLQGNQPDVECESTDQCSTKPSLGCFINPTPMKSAGIYEDEMSRMIITDEFTGEESVIEVYPVDVVTRRS